MNILVLIIQGQLNNSSLLSQEIAKTGCKYSFTDPEKFLAVGNRKFQIAAIESDFLTDFRMYLEVAKKINEKEIPFFIVSDNIEPSIIEAFSQYFPEAYIVKPYNTQIITTTLAIISKKIEHNEKNGLLKVFDNRVSYIIKIDSVVLIKAQSTFINLINTEGKAFKLRKSLIQLCEEYPSNFIQIHKSYAINKNYIISSTKSEIETPLGFHPIGRKFKVRIS